MKWLGNYSDIKVNCQICIALVLSKKSVLQMFASGEQIVHMHMLVHSTQVLTLCDCIKVKPLRGSEQKDTKYHIIKASEDNSVLWLRGRSKQKKRSNAWIIPQKKRPGNKLSPSPFARSYMRVEITSRLVSSPFVWGHQLFFSCAHFVHTLFPRNLGIWSRGDAWWDTHIHTHTCPNHSDQCPCHPCLHPGRQEEPLSRCVQATGWH